MIKGLDARFIKYQRGHVPQYPDDIATKGYVDGSIAIDKQEPGVITTEEPTWTPITNVVLSNAILATYLFNLSLTFQMADTNDSALFRYRTNNGNWFYFSLESKDNTDMVPLFYSFPLLNQSGELSIEVEATKTTGGQDMTVHFADTWIKRI